jgi:hypothetical protein
LVAAPALFWGGRYIDVEAIGFLHHYWGDGSVAQKVLDPHSVDYYRGRELSYAVDYLDAQWVRLLFQRGVFFFLAPSALLASLGLIFLGLRLVPRALPGLSPSVRWLGLLVLLSNFVFVSTMGMYYRSTKPLVAPLLLGLLLLVLAELRHPRLDPRAAFGAVLALALAMSLLDRQGLFYTLLIALALGLLWVRTRRGTGLALGALAAVAAWYVYNDWVGPALIRAASGYWPDMTFQRLRPAGLMQLQLWGGAVDILGDWTSVLLAGLPPPILVVTVVTAAAVWAWFERRRPRRVLLAAAVGLAAAGAQVVMVALMLERHPPVSWVANRLWYYPLCYQVLVVFALLWIAERLAVRRCGERVVPIALATVVAGNVALWPGHDLRMHSTPAFSEQKRRSFLLVESLEGGAAVPPLAGHYRRFYFGSLDLSPRLAAQAAAQVGEGAGIALSEVRNGRVMAWARRKSQIVPRTPRRGRYVLAGGVLLRPDDRLLVLLGSTRPRLLAEVRGDPEREGPVFFRLVADLGAGRTDIRLVSRMPERRVPNEPRRFRAGFALLLPIAVWPAPDGGSREGARPTRPPR